jgi:hypothetical protein
MAFKESGLYVENCPGNEDLSQKNAFIPYEASIQTYGQYCELGISAHPRQLLNVRANLQTSAPFSKHPGNVSPAFNSFSISMNSTTILWIAEISCWEIQSYSTG